MTDKVYYNAIRTPDGTVIESRHRHDYVCHRDDNGFMYCVDGGMAYMRRVGAMDYTEISVTDDDDHETIRGVFKWGTYGKKGAGPFRRVLLKDMTSDHILAIMDDKTHPHLDSLFHNELEYRVELALREAMTNAVGNFIEENCN